MLLNRAFDLTGKLSQQTLSSLNRLILHLGKITHKLASYIIGLVKSDCQLGWIMPMTLAKSIFGCGCQGVSEDELSE